MSDRDDSRRNSEKSRVEADVESAREPLRPWRKSKNSAHKVPRASSKESVSHHDASQSVGLLTDDDLESAGGVADWNEDDTGDSGAEGIPTQATRKKSFVHFGSVDSSGSSPVASAQPRRETSPAIFSGRTIPILADGMLKVPSGTIKQSVDTGMLKVPSGILKQRSSDTEMSNVSSGIIKSSGDTGIPKVFSGIIKSPGDTGIPKVSSGIIIPSGDTLANNVISVPGLPASATNKPTIDPAAKATAANLVINVTSNIAKTSQMSPTTALMASSTAVAPPINPFNIKHRKKRKQSVVQLGERRMSLGVALCIPPSARVSNSNMGVRKFLGLCMGALGIVFGEISVSPLYVLKTIFRGGMDDEGNSIYTEDEIIGALSILIWMVTMICCVKYVWLVLKADKTGEGGTWALISLLPLDSRGHFLHKHKSKMILIGILASSFLVADVVISPAITVLSAFEGVRAYADQFSQNSAVLCACGVLAIVFWIQRYGTATFQKVAGPIAILWFLSISMIGLYNITKHPKILAAFSPHYIWFFVRKSPINSISILGQIVLSVAGVEAMYSDLGHFSALPIRASFMAVVYPSIILNYLGQAAYLIRFPHAAHNPFFESVPSPIQWPILILATFAAIVAIQGGISGCFSLLDQSISLHVFPDCQTTHPNKEHASEVYIPFVNFAIFVGTVSLAATFQDAESLANIAGSMTVTSCLYILVMHYAWELPKWKTALFTVMFLPLDLLLFASTLRKVVSNGYISLIIAAGLFVVMYTWATTVEEIHEWLADRLLIMSELRFYIKTMPRTPGTVVYVSNTDEDVPNVLAICAGKLNSLPTNIICMTAVAQPAPFVADEEKIVFRTIDAVGGIYRLVISYGYAERTIDVLSAIERAKKRGLRIKPDEEVVFIVGREIVLSGEASTWFRRARRNLFEVLVRNTQSRVDYYNLPQVQTLEMSINVLLDDAEEPDEVAN
ncbi:hypothetical protein PhCBS80983_g02303 [Powellomyces hirtus]|uniref:Potassium transporter n=1 Tax=Powellomyces hirtus TaxID=109895 RepID=A0A507E960_9FUNG|nr:hypothetical protein PhCBS80983_g02303 [Powellomyces hirtus]